MTWQVSLALKGDLQKYLEAEVKAGRRSVYGVVNSRKNSLKNKLRKQVRATTKSQGLANTIRDWINPEKEFSANVTAYVFSKALYKRRTGLTDLITLLDTGETVRARAGKVLSIPLPAVGRGSGHKHDPVARKPSDFPEGTFYLVPAENGRTAVLRFREGSKANQAAFLLVKQVRHRKRIDIAKDYAVAIRNIDLAVARKWERESLKLVRRFDVGA
jgi:hypothetical protein